MPRASKKPLTFKREPQKYEARGDGYILGQVRKAKVMAASIRQLAEDLEGKHGRNTDTMQHMIDLFKGKVDLGIPDSKRYVGFDAKSAKPPDVIFRVMGMLISDLRSQYIAPPSTPNAQKDAIEAHLNALPGWLFRKYQTRYDLESLFWQLLVGKSFIQQTYLPAYWDHEVLERRDGEDDADYNARVAGYKAYQGPPFMRASLDPRTVFPVLDLMQGPEAYIRNYRVQRYELDAAMARVGKQVVFGPHNTVTGVEDLRKPAGRQLPRESEDADSVLEYFEYIDDVMCYYVVGDRVVHKYQHDGAIKIFPAYGLTTGFKEYADMAVGILWAVRNEMPQLDFVRTLWLQRAYLDVFPQLLAILNPEDPAIMGEDDNPVQWDIEPGTIKQIRGQLVNALRDDASGVDFRAFVEMLAGDVDLATIPSLARGIAGAQQPGYSINQLSQSMRTLWRPIIEWRELQHSSMDEHYLLTVKHKVAEPVSVFAEVEEPETGRRTGEYNTLDPDDIDDYFRVQAILNPELPIDKQGKMLTYWKLHQEGAIPYEIFVREGLDKTNPVEMLRQTQRDAMRRAFLPKATEDAMALGRVELTNEILRERGLDRLNKVFSLDIQALKEARAKQQAPAEQATAGGDGDTGRTPTGGPPGTPGGGGPAVAPGTAGETGDGIPPTTGANPNNPTPGPRR